MAYEVKKIKYTHEALADMLLTCPNMTQKELAIVFNKSPVWVGYVINSDAFQYYLAKRREEIVDPGLILTIEDRLKGLVVASTDLLMEKLESAPSADLGLRCLELGAKALGYGARPQGNVAVQANFVVAMPDKAVSAEKWAAGYTGGALEAGPAND
jgi:hypothetical protein